MGHHGPDLLLLLRWEHVVDAVDGLRRPDGVHRREDQDAHLGGGQYEPDRLQLPQLPHQEYVRIFSQRGPEPRLEAREVHVHRALVDQRLSAVVHELGGIFQHDDVLRIGPIDDVDEGRESRRLTGAGGSRDQDETLVQMGQERDGFSLRA